MPSAEKPLHTITIEPWAGSSVRVRVVCEAASLMMLGMSIDDRMTTLLSLLGNEIDGVAKDDDQIDAILDVLRMQLKFMRRQSPPLQPG